MADRAETEGRVVSEEVEKRRAGASAEPEHERRGGDPGPLSEMLHEVCGLLIIINILITKYFSAFRDYERKIMADKPKPKKQTDVFEDPISPSKSDKTKAPDDKRQDIGDIEAPQFSNLESASDQEDSDKQTEEKKEETKAGGLKRVDSRFQMQRE